MNRKPIFNSRKRSAFTLIEIMVATVIMVVLVGLVIQITSEVLKVWNRSSGKLSANAEARIALEMLTQDLETAVIRNNGMRWLEAETKTINSIAGYQPQTINMMLFSPALDRPKEDNSGNPIPGDICGVQYELVYQNPISSAKTEDKMFALHRRVIDPPTTFNELMGETNQETFTKWADGELPPTDKLAGLDLDPYPAPSDPTNYLVGHVANFRVDFYVIDENGDEVLVPTPPPVAYGGTTPSVGPGASNTALAFPLTYAEISLTVLSDEGTKLLQNLDLGRGGTGYEAGEGTEIVKQHGEVFTRRVNFVARPL